MCKNGGWVKSPATRGDCGALMGFSIRASWQKHSRILARKRGVFAPLKFASIKICRLTARLQARGNALFWLSIYFARKFFNFFSKMRVFPNVATPAVFMQ